MLQLEQQIHGVDAIRVLTGRWSWTRDSPWPPVKVVLETPLWSATSYAQLRAGLLRPTVDPKVVYGAQFITIHCSSAAVSGPQPSGPAVPAGTAVPAVPSGSPSVPSGSAGTAVPSGPTSGSTTPVLEPHSSDDDEELVTPAGHYVPIRASTIQRPSTPLAQVPQRPVSDSNIHVFGLAPDSSVPQELKVPYAAVFIELLPNISSVHPFIVRQLQQATPLLLSGPPLDVDTAVSDIRAGLPNELIEVYFMDHHTPAGSDSTFRFQRNKLALVMRKKPSFQV